MLTEAQTATLLEIMNSGVGQAGAVLSQLVGSQVTLEIPSLGLTSAADLPDRLSLAEEAELASVRQSFSGSLEGQAILLFPRESGNVLARQLIGDDPDITSIDSERKEALAEVGNILLNSVLGSMSNTLSQNLDYEVPQYREGSLQQLVTVDSDADELAGDSLLYANADFDIETFRVTGNVLVVFSLASFEQMLENLDRVSLQPTQT